MNRIFAFIQQLVSDFLIVDKGILKIYVKIFLYLKNLKFNRFYVISLRQKNFYLNF